MTDRLTRGRLKFDEVYGQGASDRFMAGYSGLAQDLARYGIEFNFGDVYRAEVPAPTAPSPSGER